MESSKSRFCLSALDAWIPLRARPLGFRISHELVGRRDAQGGGTSNSGTMKTPPRSSPNDVALAARTLVVIKVGDTFENLALSNLAVSGLLVTLRGLKPSGKGMAVSGKA